MKKLAIVFLLLLVALARAHAAFAPTAGATLLVRRAIA